MSKDLEKEIARLQAELNSEKKARSEAEEMALAVAQSNKFFGNTEEQATGKTIKVEVCINPWVKKESDHKFKELEYPTYFFKIDLPVGAGTCLTTNGTEYYHGHTYELDPMSLADLKSRVARCWDHEKSIHGENENAYRRPTQRLVA